MMFEVELFLGFPIDQEFAEILTTIDAQLASLFIRKNDSNYLQEMIYQNGKYLGKFAGEISDSHELTLLQENIYSLLRKIAPDYPSGDIPLVLFPAATSSS